MQFPLSLWDISLWLAITATILLTASEMLSSYYGKINFLINKKKLRNAALAVSALFLVTVTMRVFNIIIA